MYLNYYQVVVKILNTKTYIITILKKKFIKNIKT